MFFFYLKKYIYLKIKSYILNKGIVDLFNKNYFLIQIKIFKLYIK